MAACTWYGPTGPCGSVVGDEFQPDTDRVGVPVRPILLGERDELTVRARSRRPPRLGQDHQREQTGDFAVVGP